MNSDDWAARGTGAEALPGNGNGRGISLAGARRLGGFSPLRR
jgi:hypothetical protein